MPDTPQHRADMYTLAQQRIRAGLPVWAHTIDLSHVWHNTEMEFEDKRDAIVRILRDSQWVRGSDIGSHLVWIIAQLADAENETDFDLYMHGVYDHADHDRVWIKTF